jgi:pimeloyl-ACP methyl ester carboxylesterase
VQVEVPRTRYARSGDVSIAYQVVGNGPLDLVLAPGAVSNVEFGWQIPRMARFCERLGGFSRLIMFDKRGTGLSDRVKHVATLEARMDDVRAVMDDAGSERAVVMGVSEGGPMSAVFAATYPERTLGLILYGASAKGSWSPDYPWAPTEEQHRESLEQLEKGAWATPAHVERMLSVFAPTMLADEGFKQLWAMYLRLSASPGAVADLNRMNALIDISGVLPAIRVPSLVLHRVNDRTTAVEEGRYIAARIPGARLVELQGEDHLPFVGDDDAIVEEVRRFVAGVPSIDAEPDRVLATVLFTDIVGSTARAAELGDRAWRELVQRHHEAIRRELSRFRGKEVDTAGDGFFASFDGPARAIRCASAILDAIGELGLDLRAGLHTGECEVIDGKVVGIAVHIGARVAAQAEGGEVLVSSTVKDLVAGSGIAFRERGVAELKGVPGEWRLFAVER